MNSIPKKVDHVQLKQKNLSMDIAEPEKEGLAEKNERESSQNYITRDAVNVYAKKRQRFEKIQKLRQSSANTDQPSIEQMGRSSIGDSSHWGGADGQ